MNNLYQIAEIYNEYAKRVIHWSSVRPKFIRNSEIVLAFMPLLFILVSTVIGFFRPGYSLVQDTISTLVNGRFGSVLTLALYLLAASVSVLAIKLFGKPGTSLKYKLGIGLFSLSIVGIVIVGLHPTDIPGHATTTGAIHIATTASLIFLVPIACFMIAPGLQKAYRSRWLSAYTKSAGVMQLVLIAGIMFLSLDNLGWIGLAERIIMLNGLVWMQIANVHTLLE